MTCCGTPPIIDRFVHYGDGGRYHNDGSCEPLYRCPHCSRRGYRETFDPVAKALDYLLDLPDPPLPRGIAVWRRAA